MIILVKRMIFFIFLIVIAIIVLYTCTYYLYINLPTCIEKRDHTLRVLQLVLYNEKTEYERDMKSVTELYYQRFTYLDTYYYTYSDTIHEIQVIGNTCYIPGKESMIPGVLDKTIKAIAYFMGKDHPYEYLVRSNISTIVNFTLLTPTLHSFEYGGPMMLLYVNIGIQMCSKYFKYLLTRYIGGTAIILSKRVVHTLLSNAHKIDYDIIDDASIGYFILNHVPCATYKTYFNQYKCYGMNRARVTDKYIFYRNKSNNRKNDVFTMKRIVDQLLM